PPEHDRVHDAWVRLREHARLAERVPGDEPEALGDAVEAVLRKSAPPETRALPEAPGEDRDRDGAADVEADLRPCGNVPERVAEGHGRAHEDSNLSTGEITTGERERVRLRSAPRSFESLIRPHEDGLGGRAEDSTSDRARVCCAGGHPGAHLAGALRAARAGPGGHAVAPDR